MCVHVSVHVHMRVGGAENQAPRLLGGLLCETRPWVQSPTYLTESHPASEKSQSLSPSLLAGPLGMQIGVGGTVREPAPALLPGS